jgi:hypothetical protein
MMDDECRPRAIDHLALMVRIMQMDERKYENELVKFRPSVIQMQLYLYLLNV